MKSWIARDKDGSLWIYCRKPERGENSFESDLIACQSMSGKVFQVDKCWLKDEVTWENSPVRIKVKI